MNIRILTITAALFAMALCGTLSAEAIDSRIDKVTVYPSGARVTRLVRVPLTKGINSITLNGFPSVLDLQRVQVEAASDGVELRSVNIDTVQQQEAYSADVRRLENTIEASLDDIAAIDDVIATAELQLHFLRGLAEGYAGKEHSEAATGQANIASWREALNTLGEGAGSALERIRDARKDRVEAGKNLSVLERELGDMHGRTPSSANLLVSLASASSLETDLYVHYFQQQAWWTSTYSANLETSGNVLRLAHEARVDQNTDEDWRNVGLTLSTADPGAEMQAPEQDSRFLDLYTPRERSMVTGAMRHVESLSTAGSVEEIIVTATGVEQGRYAVRYHAPERTNISNNADQSQTVPLAEYRYDVDLVTRVTPRMDVQAYLTVRFTHDSATPLYPGSMSVIVDGAYMGLAELPELLPKTVAMLPMGPDRRVEVRVTDQGGSRGREGLLSTRNTVLTEYLFEIVNRHTRSTRVEVVDYYPVARNERITVSVPGNATPPDETDLEDRPGVIVWHKELNAGETWRILHQYEVSHPRDTYIIDR